MTPDTDDTATATPVISVKNIAFPERNLSLDGGPTIALGETGDALDTDHTRALIDEGHLLELKPSKTTAKTPGTKE